MDMAAVERVKGAVRNRAEINTINGQRVNVTAGRARSMLSDLVAVVGNSSAAFQPTIDLVLSGTALQVTPVLSADGSMVTLDLRAVLGRWDPPDGAPIRIPNTMVTTQPTLKISLGLGSSVEASC